MKRELRSNRTVPMDDISIEAEKLPQDLQEIIDEVGADNVVVTAIGVAAKTPGHPDGETALHFHTFGGQTNVIRLLRVMFDEAINASDLDPLDIASLMLEDYQT